jgi:hypothetical protein
VRRRTRKHNRIGGYRRAAIQFRSANRVRHGGFRLSVGSADLTLPAASMTRSRNYSGSVEYVGATHGPSCRPLLSRQSLGLVPIKRCGFSTLPKLQPLSHLRGISIEYSHPLPEPQELIMVSWGEHSANHLRDSTILSSGGLNRKPTRFALAESVSLSRARYSLAC